MSDIEELTAYLDSLDHIDGYRWQSGKLHVRRPEDYSHAGSAIISKLRRKHGMEVADVSFRDREVIFRHAT